MQNAALRKVVRASRVDLKRADVETRAPSPFDQKHRCALQMKAISSGLVLHRVLLSSARREQVTLR